MLWKLDISTRKLLSPGVGSQKDAKQTSRSPPKTVALYLKKGAMVATVMFTLFNITVVPEMLIVGSKVMVKDPVTGSTGAPEGIKPLAVKFIVSVIVAAFAVLAAPVDASANAPANANAPKVILFMTRSLVVTPRAEIMVPPLQR